MRHRGVLPRRVVRPVRAVPGRHRAPGGGAARGSSRARRAAACSASSPLLAEVGQCMRDASICGLGQTASSAIESAIGRLWESSRERACLIAAEADDRARDRRAAVRVLEGATILDACRRLGIDTPTLCYGETLDAGERLPRLRRRGRGRAHARARRARARPRPGWWCRPTPSACGTRRKLVLELLGLVGRPLDDAGCARVPGALRRRPRALRPAGAAGSATATASAPATTSRRTARRRPPSTPR